MMIRQIKGTSGRTTSSEYIKARLFDYLCDRMLDIDGQPAEKVAKRIEALRVVFDVDDVIDLAYEEGVELTEALAMLEDEYDQM